MDNQYKKFSLKIAKKAGEIMKKNFNLGMKKDWKKDNTPVTETDLAINTLLISEIRKNFPTHSVLAEEESDIKKNSEYVWVCDPVDGTLPFSHGLPVFTFSLALVKNGVPILGIIYDPILNRMYSAEKGRGAFLNGKKISVSKNKNLENLLVNLDGSGKELPGHPYLKIFTSFRKNKSKIFKLYSVIYSGALVAVGELGAAILLNDTAHDMASIKIIVEEAGGKVTDIQGNEQRYDRKCNGLIASNKKIHGMLVRLVNK